MIYIDVSELYHFNLTTGIQRVVRKIGRELYLKDKENDIEFVVSVGSRAYMLDKVYTESLLQSKNLEHSILIRKKPWVDWIKAILKFVPPVFRYVQAKYVQKNLANHLLNERYNNVSGLVEFKKDDKYVVLDSFWSGSSANLVAKSCLKKNIEVIVVVYDIIPITHASLFFQAFTENFRFYLNDVLKSSTKILTISEFSKRELLRIFPELNHNDIKVFPLGSNISEVVFFDPKTRTANEFLSVGTVEPRKGISTTLDAFDLLWAQGIDVNLTLVGKKGWRVDDLVSRITKHPEYGGRLIWLDNATDDMLIAKYNLCRTVIISSEVEGYGLPIIEGLSNGCQVIASNIPVFKEIGKDLVTYYEHGSCVDLASKVTIALEYKGEPSQGYEPTSWGEAAEKFSQCIGLDGNK
jgi:glycosyltransferase involved in cell wall biosynthesis